MIFAFTVTNGSSLPEPSHVLNAYTNVILKGKSEHLSILSLETRPRVHDFTFNKWKIL